MSGHYLIYVRRSYKAAAAADVSDETQEQIARSLLPAGATVEVIRDSGGHNSGATDDREGYRQLIARVQAGGIAGIAVYDLSRLARNVALMSRLREELERQQVAILAGNLPNTAHDSAVGRFTFNMVVSAAQFQRDLDSERMIAMMRSTFEGGGHRGNDPFGYQTQRDEAGKIVHPRTLVPVPHEAEIVQRVFRELPRHPFSDIAARLNGEGVRHRKLRAWTNNAIKDLWRRREVYRGNVVTRRGAEVMPGKHERILTEDEFRDAVAGVEARKVHKGKRPKSSKRLYLLRGLTYCSCGARMRGDARLSRGQEWRYYSCPVSDGKGGRLGDDGNLVACHAKRVRAAEAERFVVEALGGFLLPPDEIATAREELRERLRAPKPGVADEQRARLRNRLEKLRDLYTWGDLTEAEFRTQKAEAEAQLLALPDNNKLVMFDKHRALAASLPDAIAAAAPEKLQELVALLVERVETADCRVGRVVWVPAARPFFADVAAAAGDDGASLWRPRRESNSRRRP